MTTIEIDDNTIATVASILALGVGLLVSRGILKQFANLFFDLSFFLFFLGSSAFIFLRFKPDHSLAPHFQAFFDNLQLDAVTDAYNKAIGAFFTSQNLEKSTG